MLARTYSDFDAFDNAVAMLRDAVERMLRDGTGDDPHGTRGLHGRPDASHDTRDARDPHGTPHGDTSPPEHQ